MWKKCCPCISRTYEPPDVQELDYRHGSLCEVPPEIFSYERTLEKLDLGSNQISDLPPNLFHCHELRELDLCDNDLKEIPSAVESLNRLAKLDVSRNALSEVPESIKNCKNLTYLDLSLNQLSKLPEAICQLVHLEELFLNETALEFLPANFGRLTKLKILELRENLLQTLPKSMSRLHQLQRLDIGSNDIEELPEVIGTMSSLTELWADNNCIREIPKFIGNLTKLACLDVSKNEIREISNEIGKCINLIDFTITHNSLSTLPDAFTRLENVTTVRIDYNCVNRLPEDIGKLKSLQELSTVSNILTSLPLSIGLLRKLHTLYLDDNRLTELPIEIGSCVSLTVLSVARNNLQEIPSEIGHLSKLKMLKLTNNAIQNLPVSILGLTELGALWLTDAQNKPLVALNREIDASSGQHVVTCCLLPQLPALDVDAKKESDDEAPRRSARKIRFENDVEPPAVEKPATNGGLLRAPTPYPKELRALAKHASHIRQAKSQNGEVVNISDEPMYEGDLNDETVEHVDENYEMKPLPDSRDEPPLLKNDNHDDKIRDVVSHKEPLKYTNSFPASNQDEEQKVSTWTQPEVNVSLNTIGLPEVPYNPAPYVDDVPPQVPPFAIGRTPPPYHIAAKRAAFFRSSGGAGSGRMNFPTEVQPNNPDGIYQNPPTMSNISTGQYLGTEDSAWNQGGYMGGLVQELQPLNTAPYEESTPSPDENTALNETYTVQYNDEVVKNQNMDYDYSGALPDKNANIASAKPQYPLDVTDNSSTKVHSTQNLYDDNHTFQSPQVDMPTQNPNMLLDNNDQRPVNISETRIPLLSHKGSNINSPADSKVSRIPSIHGSTKRQFQSNAPENGNTQSQVPETPPKPSPVFKDREGPKAMKTGIPMHHESKASPAFKPNSSTSRIPSKASNEDRSPLVDSVKRNPASFGNLKYNSGIPKGNAISKSGITNLPSPVSTTSNNHDSRKSSSRIPKFDAPKATPEDVSLPSSPTNEGKPQVEMSNYYSVSNSNDKAVARGISPKPARSAIPKPSSVRTPSPTNSKIPTNRKPWIFGSHRNARVVSVEHRKINQWDLGFMIDDFAGQISPPEGKGIYIIATDADDLPVKVGDKILQVDGIDVGNMGVEIVKKILGNCQENIQLLVSRQH